jgi:hypothetical protein
MAARWLVLLSVFCACGGNAQTGTVNVPSLNKPWGPEDRGHDAIANGPEACGPTKDRPEGAKLPQCPEQASTTKARPGPPPASSAGAPRR